MKSSRSWELVLYPDAENYCCDEIIANAVQYFEQWAYILHDSDSTADGDLKKSHFHFYGRCSTPRTPQSVSNVIGVPISSIRNVSKWKSAIRYLIHADNPEKFQYEPDSVSSNFPLDGFFTISDDNQARLLMQHIIDMRSGSVVELTAWALDNGCYSSLRRGFAIWSQVLKECANPNTI